MSNFLEYKDTVAFHPGYYIEEMVEDSGLTQQDFATRLDTTPKNLSKLINGQQRLSVDMAMKLSRMLGTSLSYWLNLQNAYDEVLAKVESDRTLEQEIEILEKIDYSYFRDAFHLPSLPKQPSEQVAQVRRFLGIASLTILAKRDTAISFRAPGKEIEDETVVKANVLAQIAINEALKKKAPNYDRRKLNTAMNYALTQTTNTKGFFPLIEKAYNDAGVILVILPDLNGSKVNGATKKIGKNIMLMMNDQRLYTDSFWFTLLHETDHIAHGDLGISFENETKASSDQPIENKLVPTEAYEAFVDQHLFDLPSIQHFAFEIDRDPGIVLGKLQNDGLVSRDDSGLSSLRYKYEVVYDF
ncbi:MAG: HigA family addiction module antitoxin [Eggerthellaceae bacterium]